MKKAYFCMIPLVVLAACGGAEENKAKGKADRLQAGQYEVTAEVTTFKAADKGTPKIEAKQGDSMTRSVCVPEGATAPPAELFTDEGYTCRSGGDVFVRNGSINANLDCTGTGLSGQVGYTVTGTFTADSFEAERLLKTRLTTDGDVEINSTIRGRRTGACTAAPAAPAGSNAAK